MDELQQYNKPFMYIKAYDSQLEFPTLILNNQNTKISNRQQLAQKSPQKPSSVQQIITKYTPVKIQINPPADSKNKTQKECHKLNMETNFYHSHRFGLALKNNKIREIRIRNKAKDKINNHIREQLMKAVQESGYRCTSKPKDNNLKENTRKGKHGIQFGIAGRPVTHQRRSYSRSDSPEVYPDIPFIKPQLTVLDFSKLQKLLRHDLTHNSNPQNPHSSNPQLSSYQKLNPFFNDYSVTQPQQIHNRRPISSVKRRRAYSKMTGNIGSDMYEFGNNKEQNVMLAGGNSQHINAWAVRKNQDQEEILF